MNSELSREGYNIYEMELSSGSFNSFWSVVLIQWILIYPVDSSIHPLKNYNHDNNITLKPHLKQEKTPETGPV